MADCSAADLPSRVWASGASPLRRGYIAGLLLGGFSLWPGAAHALEDTVDQRHAGIRHIHRSGVDAAGVRQNYHIAVVDLSHPQIRVQVANNRDTWGGAQETVSGMARRHGATLAVNGDYWSWQPNDKPQGTTVVDGYCYRAHPERSAIAFSQDKSRVEIGRFGTWPIADPPPDDCPGWIDQAISAGPQFLYGGEFRWEERPHPENARHPNINEDTFLGTEAWQWDTARQPNTAVGISADGRSLILITCDGRGAGGAGGCRMGREMPALMREFGAHDALKLDSGGSTTFYYDGRVQNFPSGGTERAVVNALLVFSDPEPPPPPPSCEIPTDGIIDDQSPCTERHGRFWWPQEQGYGGGAQYTWAIADAERDSWVSWRFEIPRTGTYRLEAFVDGTGALSQSVPYQILSGGERLSVRLDQSSARGGWGELGRFLLPAGTVTVEAADNTGESFFGNDDPRNRKFIFDALRIREESARPPDTDAPDAGRPPMPDAGAPTTGGPSPDAGDSPWVDDNATDAPRADAPSNSCRCITAASGGPRWHAAGLGALVLAPILLISRRRRNTARASR